MAGEIRSNIAEALEAASSLRGSASRATPAFSLHAGAAPTAPAAAFDAAAGSISSSIEALGVAMLLDARAMSAASATFAATDTTLAEAMSSSLGTEVTPGFTAVHAEAGR